MSENTTNKLPNEASFEARVFARFDASDAQYREISERLERLEARSFDTKPIWERALAELLGVKVELAEVKGELAEVKGELAEVKGELAEVKRELAEVKGELRNLNRKLDVLSKDIVQLRADQVDLDQRFEKLESKPTQH